MARAKAVPVPIEPTGESEKASVSPAPTPRLFKKMKPEPFFRATAEWPEKNGITFRLYRCWPVIDRRLTGNDKSIDTTTELDLNYIKQTWGSGEYLIYFHDANRPKNSQSLATTSVEIEDPDFPPVLDQAELVHGRKENESYIRGLKLRGQWLADQREVTMTEPRDNAAEVVRQVLEHEREMSNRPVPAAPGAREAVEIVTEAYKSAARNLGAPNNGDPATLLHMQQQHELLLEMMRQQHRGGGSHGSIDDDFGRLEKLLSVVDKVRGSGESSPWNTLLASLPGVIAAGVQLMAQRPAAPVPALPVNYPAPGPVQWPPSELLNAPEIPAAGGDVGLMNRIMQSGKAAIDAFTLGLTGDQFAELLERKHGEDAYLELAGLGKEFIWSSLKAYPHAWAVMQAQRPEVEAFIDAFLEYGTPAPTPGGAAA